MEKRGTQQKFSPTFPNFSDPPLKKSSRTLDPMFALCRNTSEDACSAWPLAPQPSGYSPTCVACSPFELLFNDDQLLVTVLITLLGVIKTKPFI